MAIAKKGTRRIVVDDEPYRWLIRRKATYSQSDYGIGTLHVAIEHAHESGAVLIVYTGRAHPKDWATEEVSPIHPSDVAGWIRQALASGWEPSQPGPQFALDCEANA